MGKCGNRWRWTEVSVYIIETTGQYHATYTFVFGVGGERGCNSKDLSEVCCFSFSRFNPCRARILKTWDHLVYTLWQIVAACVLMGGI